MSYRSELPLSYDNNITRNVEFVKMVLGAMPTYNIQNQQQVQ